MTWTAPRTWVASEIVTASVMNTHVRDNLLAAQELEARFHERTAALSPWARLSPDVQHVRWALEELRLSLLAQNLRTAFPVSVKRVTALVDRL